MYSRDVAAFIMFAAAPIDRAVERELGNAGRRAAWRPTSSPNTARI